MRTIAVVTTSRADYGIYRPVLRAIAAEPTLSLRLLVSGSHLSPRFGMTVREIEADGWTPDDLVPLALDSDTPKAIAQAMAGSTSGFAGAFERSRPDILVVLGDRFEMFGAALAALPFRIPVAHLHGGELTEGAIDDALRHSMTKLSHLHFVATEEYGRRVVRMGEEAWRVTVAGAPSLDELASVPRLTEAELKEQFNLVITPATLLVTFHAATLELDPGVQAAEVMAALAAVARPVVFTMPNADTGGCAIRERIEVFVRTHPAAQAVENLGTRAYFTVMERCAAMVGNSSSGLIEAPSFGLPVVNIGLRQRGRARGANVLDVPCERDAIGEGIRRATNPAFRLAIQGLSNPYGDGHAAPRIVARLRDVGLSERLLMKQFQDASSPQAAE